MAENYKKRVALFLRQVTEAPVDLREKDQTDYYQKIEEAKNVCQEHFYYKNSTDVMRITSQIEKNAILDTQPPQKIEREAWIMRPRMKDKELGPKIRFNSHN